MLIGFKNVFKGVGFFVGSVLLLLFGFVNVLWIMVGGLFLIMLIGLILLKNMGKIKRKVKFKEFFFKS